ncbi:MAG: HAD family phosphatase [Planctomycetota bacterium]
MTGFEEYARFAGLIFDCDGTLSDSMPLHYRAWRQTMASYGIDFPEEKFYSLGGMPTDQIILLLSREQGVAVDPVTAGREKEDAFQELLPELRPMDQVCSLARACEGIVPMAVASGGDRPGVRRQLQHLGLESLFPVVVTSEDTERHKPHPDVFLEAARQLGVPPEACFVFEDSPLGFQAAETAGMGWADVRDWRD